MSKPTEPAQQIEQWEVYLEQQQKLRCDALSQVQSLLSQADINVGQLQEAYEKTDAQTWAQLQLQFGLDAGGDVLPLAPTASAWRLRTKAMSV